MSTSSGRGASICAKTMLSIAFYVLIKGDTGLWQRDTHGDLKLGKEEGSQLLDHISTLGDESFQLLEIGGLCSLRLPDHDLNDIILRAVAFIILTRTCREKNKDGFPEGNTVLGHGSHSNSDIFSIWSIVKIQSCLTRNTNDIILEIPDSMWTFSQRCWHIDEVFRWPILHLQIIAKQ